MCHAARGLAEDGVERCLPDTPGEVVFLDAACHNPVLLNGAPCGSGEPTGYKQYEDATGASCQKRIRIVKIGARTDAPPHWFTIDSTGNCVDSTDTPVGRTFYGLSPVPASDWVAYRRTVTRVTSQLGVETFTGEDGSRIHGTLRLMPGDIECEPLASDGNPSTVAAIRCIPTARVNEAAYYTDGACSTAVTAGKPCDAPVIGQRSTRANGCPAVTYFELGSTVPAAKLFWKLPDEAKGVPPEQATCVPANASVLASGVYNQIGADIDVRRYPLMEAKPAGTGRVQALFWESEGVPLEYVSGMLGNDAPAGQQCSLDEFGDGNDRCVFSLGSGYDQEYYGDTACTRPLYSMDARLPDCGDPITKPRWVQASHTVFQPALSNGETCLTQASDETVRPVLGEHMGPVYVKGSTSSDSCTVLNPRDLPLVGDPGQPEKLLFYDLGDPVDPATLFAPITTSEL